jgi:hypothetical protein
MGHLTVYAGAQYIQIPTKLLFLVTPIVMIPSCLSIIVLSHRYALRKLQGAVARTPP